MVVTPKLVAGLLALGIAVLIPVIVKRARLLRERTKNGD